MFLPFLHRRFASPRLLEDDEEEEEEEEEEEKEEEEGVRWFARWPVVSTPLHMVTYHQSTPATRFAPRAPWIFMDRK